MSDTSSIAKSLLPQTQRRCTTGLIVPSDPTRTGYADPQDSHVPIRCSAFSSLDIVTKPENVAEEVNVTFPDNIPYLMVGQSLW